jgi:type IV pilus assembly protein PilP
MKTPRAIILTIAAVFCIVVVNWGCDSGAKAPSKPKVVRKKIVRDTKAKTAPATSAIKRPGRKQPPPRPKSDIAAAKPSRPAPKAPAVVAAPASSALRPKSDISATVSQSPPASVVAQKPGSVDDEGKASRVAVPQPKPSPPADAAPLGTKPAVVSPTVGVAPDQPPAGPRPTPPTGTAPANLNQAAAAKKATAGEKTTPELYNPKGKIDPFEPLYKDEPEIRATKKTERVKRVPRTPLEKIELGQLKLVGIITARSGNRALVQEASGKGYIIKEGTYIGLNSGKVVQITRDRVIIEEEYEDIVGKIATRKKEITLPKPPGE